MVAPATPKLFASSPATVLPILVAAEGSAQHHYLSEPSLSVGRNATRNLADVIHHLSLLHGRQPGVVDHAAHHTAHPAVRGWLLDATAGFVRERTVLTKLAVAIGPLPSTPGQNETESAVLAQQHALEMLAQSDRVGCAFGAAAALVLDWVAVRTVLDRAAHRLGVDVPESFLPNMVETNHAITALSDSVAVERAVSFGAKQLLAQHRGLWDLMAARQIARGES